MRLEVDFINVVCWTIGLLGGIALLMEWRDGKRSGRKMFDAGFVAGRNSTSAEIVALTERERTERARVCELERILGNSVDAYAAMRTAIDDVCISDWLDSDFPHGPPCQIRDLEDETEMNFPMTIGEALALEAALIAAQKHETEQEDQHAADGHPPTIIPTMAHTGRFRTVGNSDGLPRP